MAKPTTFPSFNTLLTGFSTLFLVSSLMIENTSCRGFPIASDSLLELSLAFQRWAGAAFPKAQWHREWPVQHRLDSGSLVSGFVDLVLDLEDGFVVVDHKSYPGSIADAEARAASHAGQLLAYSRAITAATGKPCLGHYIHLPISGVVIPVIAAKGDG